MNRTCERCRRTFSDRGYGVHFARMHAKKNADPPNNDNKSYDPLKRPSPEIELIFVGKMLASLRADKSINDQNDKRIKLYFDLLDNALERINRQYNGD